MSTPTEIANKALAHVGTSPIIDIDDQNSKRAELVRTFYSGAKDRVLEDADWTFATKRSVLAKDANKPIFEYAAQYVLPSNVIRVIKATDDPDFPHQDKYDTFKWVREGRFILTRDAPSEIYIKYVDRIDDPGLFSPYFSDCVAYALAMELCIPLTESSAHKERLEKTYQTFLDEGAMKDGSQGSREELTANRLVSHR